jgi:uncharacterized membrane protein YcjF (UPF0283 family)
MSEISFPNCSETENIKGSDHDADGTIKRSEQPGSGGNAVKLPRSTRMRHRQWRELFETFTLFFSLALLLLCAGFVMRAIKAPDWVTITVILFALPCFVASVLKPICYFARWIEDVGLPDDRNVYQVVLRQDL